MSNSSAYNNFLLNVSAQPNVAQASVAKRNYQDDQSSASFQQNFKDAHDNVRAQDEKIAKPAATKKTAHVDNRKPANDVGRKSPAPAKQVEQNRSRDQVAENEKPADKDDKLANQNSDAQSSHDKAVENKNTAKKVDEDEVPAVDVVVTNALLTNTNMAIPVLVAPPTDVAAAQASVSVETDAQVKTTDESAELISNLAMVDANPTGTVKDGASSSDQVQTDKPALTLVEEPVTSDVSALIAQQLVADGALPQTPAAVGSATVLPKSTLAKSALTPIDDGTSDADALNALAIATEKPSSKAVAASDLSMATTTDSAPAPVLEQKSAFEKTLQNLIQPEINARDENKTASTAVPTTSTASNSINALDSMLRFSDAQTPATRSFVVQTAVPVPVGQPQWSQAVGEKVLWLAAQNVSSAEIHLNPEDLGPVQVKVSVNQEQTTVNFTSHHAVVREALDQNLGRLRDMFSEQGLNLVNVDVSDKSFNRQQGEAKDQKGQATNGDLPNEDETQVAMSVITQQRLVDHYA